MVSNPKWNPSAEVLHCDSFFFSFSFSDFGSLVALSDRTVIIKLITCMLYITSLIFCLNWVENTSNLLSKGSFKSLGAEAYIWLSISVCLVQFSPSTGQLRYLYNIMPGIFLFYLSHHRRYLCSLPSFASETMLLSLGKHLSCLLFTLGYIQQYIMRGQLGIVGRRIQLQTFVVSKEYRVIEFSEWLTFSRIV